MSKRGFVPSVSEPPRPLGRGPVDDSTAVGLLATEIRQLLAERPNVRSRKARQAWRARVDGAVLQYREDVGEANGSKAEPDVVPLQWSATDAGLHSAAGPEGEQLRVARDRDGMRLHRWTVSRKYSDRPISSGVHRDLKGAQAEAEAHCPTHLTKAGN